MRPTILIMTLVAAAPLQADTVFRCQDEAGTVFSDQPCGQDAERLELPDNRIGGDFGSNLPAPPEREEMAGEEQPASGADSAEPDPCRHISSTRLRRHIVRNEVVAGMTTEQVREALGRPPETYAQPQQTWVYHSDYYGHLYRLTFIYFRNGCVASVEYREP